MAKTKTVAERIAAENSQVPMCGLFNRYEQMYAAFLSLEDAKKFKLPGETIRNVFVTAKLTKPDPKARTK